MSLIMVLATPARSGPIPHRRGDEESRGNHPGEQVVRLLTIHPIRRKPHGQHSSASDDHTGTTKAWPPHGDRIEDKTMKSNGAPPFTKSGKGTRTCVLTTTPDAPHRIEYQIKLH
ncbi:MAG: hypothetical protein QOG75_643 [Mycobacterium sp.]|nr:hypothetical protein [Mycobacterium sp.]